MHRSSRGKSRRKNRNRNRAVRTNPQITHRTTTPTNAAAAPAGHPQARQIANGRPQARTGRPPRTPAERSALNDFHLASYTRWLTHRGLRPNTISTYQGGLRRVAKWLEAQHQTTLLHATREQLAQWRDGLDGMTPRSIVSYIAHVHSFYRWAELEEVSTAPDPSRALIAPRVPRAIPRPISEADAEFAIDTAPERIRPWLILAGYAGLRACEIATLDREHVFDRADEPYMIVIGKGGKERVVHLSPYVLGELLAVMPRRGWLFLRRDGQAGHVPAHEVTRLCNEHLAACGMQETLHKLRHRFGTQVQRATKDIRVTQELLGHADPRTTAGYSAVSDPGLVRGVNAVQPKGRRLRSARRRPRGGQASADS